MKINRQHRKTLVYYLNEFNKHYPNERYTVFHFVKYLKLRCKNNKDAWIGVSGETGSGKSLLTLIIGILFGRPFSLVDNVSYIPRGNEMIEKMEKLNFNVFINDEAAKQMRSVNWQDKQQQAVNVNAMTERYRNNVNLLNIPNFAEFTKSMRMGSLIFRIIVLYRTKEHARVIVQRKSRNFRSSDPWGDKLANDKYERHEKKRREITNDTMLIIERGIHSTIMDFIVPNLEIILPEVTKEYERLKIESRKIENSKDPIVQKNVFKNKYETLLSKVTKILHHNELDIGKLRVTKTSIASALGISVSTFNQYLLKRRDLGESNKPNRPS